MIDAAFQQDGRIIKYLEKSEVGCVIYNTELEYLKKLGAHSWVDLDEKTVVGDIKDNPYQCSIDYDGNGLMIEITKLKDDYFIVNYAVSDYGDYGEGLFLCDQFEGLKKLLKDKKYSI